MDEVIFLYMPSSDLVETLKSGDIDVIYNLEVAGVDALEEYPNTVVVQAPSGSYMNLAMDVRQPPFDNVLVRRALQVATDREAILQGAQRGLGGIAYDHPITEGDPFFNPSCKPPAYDADLARELLAQAGYPSGIDLTLYTSAAGASMVEMAEVFQETAAAAGIRVDVVVMPEDSYWSDVWLQMPFITSWWNGRTPYEAFSVVYRSDAVWNESYYSNPRLDAGLDRAQGDLENQQQIFGELQCLVVDEVPRIIPVFRPVLLGLRNEVRGVEPMWDGTLSLHRAWLEDGAASTPAPIQPPHGLVAWWPGDGNADDVIGGNHGTLLNGATFAPGIVGQAFSFDGSGAYVRIPDSVSLDVPSSTVAAWINVRRHRRAQGDYNFASRWFVVAPGELGQLSWEFGIRDERLGAYISSDCSTSNNGLISANTLATDRWYHIALVVDVTLPRS